MRVTFDDQIFTGQRVGGVARYFAELVHEFEGNSVHGVAPRTPFRYVINEHLIDLDPARFRMPRGPRASRRGAILRARNATRYATPLRRADLLHHTYYLSSYLRLPARRRVCTIYDMIPELLPELYPAGSPHLAKRDYVERCDAVLCISQSTKNDLLRLYGGLDKPVDVTPLAVGDKYYDARPAPVLDRRYVAYVGRREDYKNFDVLLRAFAQLSHEASDVALLCVGGGEFLPAERTRIADLGLADRVMRIDLADDLMPGLYASAVAMVFPSRYEGFGLPIVEGFAANCPVVVADTPCSIEVSGGAAQVFQADDDEKLAAVVARLAADPAERARWVKAGRGRADDFSWTRTAMLTADCYRRLGQTL